jgi:thioesterase domain-containing protein
MPERSEHAQALQETLDHEIPLTGHIGLRVAEYDGERLTLSAPLAPNINHKATAFAGSLNAVATLTGWGLVWLILRERDLRGTIVISESTARYRLPVRGDFRATCHIPQPETVQQFVETMRRRGKGRLALTIDMFDDHSGEQPAVSFTGSYVAFRD